MKSGIASTGATTQKKDGSDSDRHYQTLLQQEENDPLIIAD